MNKVDMLSARIIKIRKEIDEIQKSCRHKFEIMVEPKLEKTLIAGVFVGDTAGPTTIGYSNLRFTVRCPGCSQVLEKQANTTCPECLEEMKKGACLGNGSREKYFGVEFLYNSITLSSCQKCGFTVASDEWDQ